MVSLRQVSVSTTQAPQFVDITDAVQREVDASGVREGVARSAGPISWSRSSRCPA